MKIPCEECILLAMCVSKEEIKCTILFKFLDKARAKLVHPEWSKLLKNMRKVLKGVWCPVSLNEYTYSVQKNRGPHSDSI